jgi:tellurite resistance protein TehA-like permease
VSTAATATARRTGVLGEAATVTAVATWAVGVVLYLVLLTVLLLRLLVVPVRPRQMTTPYWIVMGATAIIVVAGSRILRLDPAHSLVRLAAPLVGGLSFVLWAFGTWTIPLLVAFGVWRHVLRRDRPGYTPQLWTLVFPLGMYSVAWVAVFGMMLASSAPRRAGHDTTACGSTE